MDLTLELLSPCFLGGAHQDPEFRIASLRGVWRYWYRALYGHGNETAPADTEIRIFGSTKRRGSARIVPRHPVGSLETTTWSKRGGRDQRGADYLLFSMHTRAKGEDRQRAYLTPGQTVNLRLILGEEDTEAERALRSLGAACSFSGLGARARRLAGAVSLRTDAGGVVRKAPWIADVPAKDTEELAQRVRGLLGPALARACQRPQYHVVAQGWFSAGVVTRTFPGWEMALDDVGSAYRLFRQFDPPGSQRRRRPDYDVVKSVVARQPPPPGQTVTRAAFGLPIEFRFNSLSGSPKERVTLPSREGEKPGETRRGSPLFLTLDKLANGRLALIWCLFRSPLAPDGRIRVGPTDYPAPDLSRSIIDEMLGQPFWASHRIA
ncbi:MAG: type III-B CRISPR module RAMP protein Cmr1 [Candidatus Rokubacteria bacterium]|nr:type III-B CRISPR module RAMP protein Cmr1 [Candidatus Rokubacteria bacterium]